MPNRTGIAVRFALALLLGAMVVPAAGADGRKPRRIRSDLERLETFNVSGEYSGTLGGEVLLGGTRYVLGPNVQVYEIGRGLLPAGSVIESRYIFISGVRDHGSDVIFSVIVRPATVPSLDQDNPSSHVSISTTSPEDE
jgi:hypothetical protein